MSSDIAGNHVDVTWSEVNMSDVGSKVKHEVKLNDFPYVDSDLVRIKIEYYTDNHVLNHFTVRGNDNLSDKAFLMEFGRQLYKLVMRKTKQAEVKIMSDLSSDAADGKFVIEFGRKKPSW